MTSSFAAKEVEKTHIGNSWKGHGKLSTEAGYDDNINDAPNKGGLDGIGDAYGKFQGSYFLHRVFNKTTYVNISTDALFHCYVERGSLNYHNMDVTGKVHHMLKDDLGIALRARCGRHYQPVVVNETSELTGETFTNNYTHWEYAVNPIISYFWGKNTVIEVSDILTKRDYEKVSHRTAYNNTHNIVHLIVKHSTGDWKGKVIGSYSVMDYAYVHPFYGGTGTSAGNMNSSLHKKLNEYSGMCHVGYKYGKFTPGAAYTYKHQSDRYQGYSSFNTHQLAVMLSYRLNPKLVTSTHLSYEHQKYLNRFSGASKVRYYTYGASCNVSWQCHDSMNVVGKVSYDKRNTNVASGSLDRPYAKLISEAGLHYVF
jgi:hypothetical protein